jgi:hypothetical protein
MPLRAPALVQVQEPWLLQPFLLYPCLLRWGGAVVEPIQPGFAEDGKSRRN